MLAGKKGPSYALVQSIPSPARNRLADRRKFRVGNDASADILLHARITPFENRRRSIDSRG